jgi:hypothetical protein
MSERARSLLSCIPLPMNHRALFLFATVAVSSAAAGIACSAKDAVGFAPDDDGGSHATDATSGHDTSATNPDADDTNNAPHDAGTGPDAAATPETGSGSGGHCSAVQGPACDLVLQNCPAMNGHAQECVVAQGAGGGLTTACDLVAASQHLSKGHGCCPGASGNQCGAGLECIGDMNAACDGGVLPGRCSPHCCGGDAGDDFLCGASDPEGIAGHCDLEISYGSTPAFTSCSYDDVCKPFHVKPCSANSTCIIKDTSGTAGCYPIYSPDGGAAAQEGQPCAAANSCADGLICLGSGAVGTCMMLCLNGNKPAPYDAGSPDGGPFYGGCSSGKHCTVNVVGPDGGAALPPWISICN